MYLAIFLIGLILGSFVTALVWRLHEQSKTNAKKSHTVKSELNLTMSTGRSMCPRCKHQLSALDLVPVLSWVLFGGKCRYCKRKIPISYPLTELSTGLLFVFCYIYWPNVLSSIGMFEFISWLIILTGLIALFIYDFKWMLLPNAIVYSLIVIALVRLVALLLLTNNLDILYGAFWGVLVLFGLFYLLFQISGGKWIGGGDVKLAILLGILVGGPLMSMLLLFIASLLGTIYALPLVIKGKVRQHKVIPFGPFLITATIVVMLFGVQIINWYKIGLGV